MQKEKYEVQKFNIEQIKLKTQEIIWKHKPNCLKNEITL